MMAHYWFATIRISEFKKGAGMSKVEVNKYMNLVANTQSFTHPLNDNELRKYKNCVFQKSKDFDGELWSGQAVKPITIKTVKDGEYDLNKLFILKKKSKN